MVKVALPKPMADSIVMHIDVCRLYAGEFGTHYQTIDRTVQAARGAGAKIIGVSFDRSRHSCRWVPYPEVDDRFSSGYSLLVKPAARDLHFEKVQPSALAGNGGGLLRDKLAGLPHRTIYVTGYFADQCVWMTARDMAEALPRKRIVVLDNLCGARTDQQALDVLPELYRNVSLQSSDTLPLPPDAVPDVPRRRPPLAYSERL